MLSDLSYFLILVIIQFVVIKKVPKELRKWCKIYGCYAGKEMSIDADLGAGLIDEEGARKRRAR